MAVRRQVRLRLALPWFAEAVAAAADERAGVTRAPATEWLITRGRSLAGHSGGWRAWLMGGAACPPRLLQRFPAGPCVRALQLGSRVEGYWACARPVHLLTAIDHLQIAPTVVALEAEEAAAVARDLSTHFADRGFVFHADRPGPDWALACPSPTDCVSCEPAGVSGRNLRELMPAGRDGRGVRSLMNEIQMLLHDHPVNDHRAARGLPVVNSLWLWGFGCAEAVTQFAPPVICTDDAWLAGLWMLHGRKARPIGELAELMRIDGEALLGWCGLPATAPGAAIEEVERSCFAPMRSALRSGAVEALEMLLGERAYVVDRGARLRFFRRGKPLSELLA
ncbi:MAG: hypothetical protein U1F09_06375 [Steroidobacteraceae bacterium]